MWRRPGWSGTGTGPAVSRWLPKFLSIKIVETEFDSLFLRSLPLSLLPLYVSNGYTASKTKPDRIPPASVSRFAGKGTGLGRKDMASYVRANWLPRTKVGVQKR